MPARAQSASSEGGGDEQHLHAQGKSRPWWPRPQQRHGGNEHHAPRGPTRCGRKSGATGGATPLVTRTTCRTRGTHFAWSILQVVPPHDAHAVCRLDVGLADRGEKSPPRLHDGIEVERPLGGAIALPHLGLMVVVHLDSVWMAPAARAFGPGWQPLGDPGARIPPQARGSWYDRQHICRPTGYAESWPQNATRRCGDATARPSRQEYGVKRDVVRRLQRLAHEISAAGVVTAPETRLQVVTKHPPPSFEMGSSPA